MNPKVFMFKEAEQRGLFSKFLDEWYGEDSSTDVEWNRDYNRVCSLMEMKPELIKDYTWLEIFYIARTGEKPPSK